MALLKNSDSELMDLLPSNNDNKNKSRSTTITSNNEHSTDETGKAQKTSGTNYGSRLQNTGT